MFHWCCNFTTLHEFSHLVLLVLSPKHLYSLCRLMCFLARSYHMTFAFRNLTQFLQTMFCLWSALQACLCQSSLYPSLHWWSLLHGESVSFIAVEKVFVMKQGSRIRDNITSKWRVWRSWCVCFPCWTEIAWRDITCLSRWTSLNSWWAFPTRSSFT